MTDPERAPDTTTTSPGGSQSDNASGSADQEKVEPWTRDEPVEPSVGSDPGVGAVPAPGGGDVGNAESVPVASDQPLEGSSETLPVAEGIHTPPEE